jgi:hypothetical protein
MSARRTQIIRALAPVTGEERATEMVDIAADIERVASWGDADAHRVVTRLARGHGATAVAARRLLDRGRSPQPQESEGSTRTSFVDALVKLLGPSLGDDNARTIIARELHARGLTPSALDRSGALDVLEGLASRGGPEGIVARFAKARAVLTLPAR